jgi:hypothetical protein
VGRLPQMRKMPHQPSVLVGRRELPDVEVLAGVGW